MDNTKNTVKVGDTVRSTGLTATGGLDYTGTVLEVINQYYVKVEWHKWQDESFVSSEPISRLEVVKVYEAEMADGQKYKMYTNIKTDEDLDGAGGGGTSKNETVKIQVHGGFNHPDKRDRLTVSFRKQDQTLIEYDNVTHSSAKRLERLINGYNIQDKYYNGDKLSEVKVEISNTGVYLGWWGVGAIYHVVSRPEAIYSEDQVIIQAGEWRVVVSQNIFFYLQRLHDGVWNSQDNGTAEGMIKKFMDQITPKVKLTEKQHSLLWVDFKEPWDSTKRSPDTDDDFYGLELLSEELETGKTVSATPELVKEAEYQLDKFYNNMGVEGALGETASYRGLIKKLQKAQEELDGSGGGGEPEEDHYHCGRCGEKVLLSKVSNVYMLELRLCSFCERLDADGEEMAYEMYLERRAERKNEEALYGYELEPEEAPPYPRYWVKPGEGKVTAVVSDPDFDIF